MKKSCHVQHIFPSQDAPFFTPDSEGSKINPVVTPRDGETVSRAVDDGNGFRVVKHDVEGHAIAAALKRRGLLEEALLASLV